MSLFDVHTVPAITDAPQEPRYYQKGSIEAASGAYKRGVCRQLQVLATGTGKTNIFAWLIDEHLSKHGGKALVIAHRDELLDQAARRIRMLTGRRVEIEAAEQRASDQAEVIVASVATVGRTGSTRMAWLEGKVTILVCDEAHHSAADSYVATFKRFVGPNTLLLGVTATAHRLDNKPLHGTDQRAIYDEVTYEYGILQGVEDKFLCPIRAVYVETNLDLSQVKTTAGDYNTHQLAEAIEDSDLDLQTVAAWLRYAEGRRTITFSPTIETARALQASFEAANVRSVVIDSQMRADDRAEAVRMFRSGEATVLCNCGIATEGFDVPECACVVLGRPTQSWSLYSQMIGRGTRIAPGKKDLLVLDMCQMILKHNLAKPPVNIAEVLDLPTNYKPKSTEDVTATANKWKELDPLARAALAKQAELTLEKIETRCTEVDILRAAEPIEGTAIVWILTGDESVYASLGSKRSATITRNTLGQWILSIKSEAETTETVIDCPNCETINQAARRAETLRLVHVNQLTDRRASWRDRPMSGKQAATLRRRGIEPGNDWSMGRASDVISMAIARQG